MTALPVGTKVVTDRGPGVVVDTWLRSETIGRPAEEHPVILLDEPELVWYARSDQIITAAIVGQLSLDDEDTG